MELAEYDFEIFYKPRKTNIIADALSRSPIEFSINVTTRAQRLKKTKDSKEKEVSSKTREKTLKEDVIPEVNMSRVSHSIRFQGGNIVSLINAKGKNLDIETSEILKIRNITSNAFIEHGQIEIHKFKRKAFFIMCVVFLIRWDHQKLSYTFSWKILIL